MLKFMLKIMFVLQRNLNKNKNYKLKIFFFFVCFVVSSFVLISCFTFLLNCSKTPLPSRAELTRMKAPTSQTKWVFGIRTREDISSTGYLGGVTNQTATRRSTLAVIFKYIVIILFFFLIILNARF